MLSGESYNGPPEFSVKIGGIDLGSGYVINSIDTAKSGRLAAARSVDLYLQTFDFIVPDSKFNPHGDLEVEFLNDAYGGDGSGLDRNLVIDRVLINGREVAPDTFKVFVNGAESPKEMILGHLVLWAQDMIATTAPPEGGWPMARQAETPSVAADTSTKADNPSPKSKRPQSPTTLPSPTGKVEVAALPAPQVECPRRKIDVRGFARASGVIPDAQQQALREFLAKLPAGVCQLKIIGYSSMIGTADANSAVAKSRADSVLDFIKQTGGSFGMLKITPFGGTNQFGRAAENQRVVVSVGP